MDYDSDFDELVLLHLIRDDKVLKRAKELKMLPTDMLSSEIAGIRVYSVVFEAAMEVGTAPINRNLLGTLVRNKAKEQLMELPDAPELEALFNYFYTDELNSAYVTAALPDFIKKRRFTKVHDNHRKDTVKLLDELNKVAVDLSQNETSADTTIASPFDSIIYTDFSIGMLTGFNEIDAKFHGLAKQECGLLLGHSGSGKTATAASIARYAALYGHKVLYFSLEEPHQNIVHRWYAAQFDLSYTKLHYGLGSPSAENRSSVKLELEACFNEIDEGTRAALKNLKIIDARAFTPISSDRILALAEAEAQKGFVADLIIVDQLDYVKPNRDMAKSAQPWQEYERSAFDLDHMSNQTLGGEATFGLWVVHQAKGQMKWEFGYDDISGFKGIVKPFDMALGVGRHDKDHPYVNLFSLKVRHTAHFRQSYFADFEKMRFAVASWSPEQAKTAAGPVKGKKPKGNFADEDVDDSLAAKKITPPKKHLL